MSALTADTSLDLVPPGFFELPVKEGEDLWRHAMLCLDGDGLLVPGANTAGLRFVGLGLESLENAPADSRMRIDGWSCFLAAGSGFTAADVGKRVFIADDQTVALTTTNRVCCGRIVQFVSATQVLVDPRDRLQQELVLPIALGDLGAGLTAKVAAVLKAPLGRKLYLREVQVGGTPTGTCTADVKVAGTSVLNAAVGFAATPARATIDTPLIAADAVITITVTTAASTGAVVGATVTLVLEVL